MATVVNITGFNATFTVGSGPIQLDTNSWAITEVTDSAEAMNSLTGVRPVPLATWLHMTAVIDFDVDTANPQIQGSGGPGIYPGSQLTSLSFYQATGAAKGATSLSAITAPTSNTVPGWTASNAMVRSLNNVARIKGSAIMNYNCTIICYGTVTRPY